MFLKPKKKLKDIEAPPGFFTNIYRNKDTYLLQFTQDANLTDQKTITHLCPNTFETLCNKEPIIVTVIDMRREGVYVSEYPDNVALDKFVHLIEQAIKGE